MYSEKVSALYLKYEDPHSQFYNLDPYAQPCPAPPTPPLTPPNTHWKDNGMGHCSPYCMDYAAQIAWILQLTSTRWQHFLTKNCPSWWTSVAYGLDTNCGVLLIYLWGADFGAKYLSSQ